MNVIDLMSVTLQAGPILRHQVRGQRTPKETILNRNQPQGHSNKKHLQQKSAPRDGSNNQKHRCRRHPPPKIDSRIQKILCTEIHPSTWLQNIKNKIMHITPPPLPNRDPRPPLEKAASVGSPAATLSFWARRDAAARPPAAPGPRSNKNQRKLSLANDQITIISASWAFHL